MDKWIVLSVSMSMIGGISWFFFGKKGEGKKTTEKSSGIERIELNISGMHCAGCAAGIEATLGATEGIITASVNLATSKGVFEFDPSKIAKEQIIKKIGELGYQASESMEDFEKKS
ncbi:heavy-metal-associated domain-containing protein [Persephonella atlantica]|uniref:Heavy-metal-associated domain-containing protein n=1 Tax=Persephonella atlantica TaxID=2699429 RepID=A0ABS1GGE7_9AQUI|nr:heavy metal-associated domain-containing protein [Persephonella atlantica]MBK3331946.1 heavy-metal-associated domain-containing protein [Persephonella atlantica]